MNFDYSKLNGQASPFYRVSVKALVFDEEHRLLIGEAEDGTWEMPGGGLEHHEAIEECLNRELMEELGVKLESLGKIICIYRGVNKRGFRALKIAIEAKLAGYEFKYGELINSKFVTKKELLELPMSTDEVGIKDYVELIWPSVEK